MAEEIVKKRRARIKVTPTEAATPEPIVEVVPIAIDTTTSNSSQEEKPMNVESTEKVETILSKTEKRVPERTYE